MSGFGVIRNFAAIEIDGERNVSFGCISGGLVLDPVIQPPPLVNDDQRRMLPGALR
jgi:hypothetical protein